MKNKKILPPTYLFFSLLLSITLNYFIPIKQIIPDNLIFIGFILILFGFQLNFWASYLFSKQNTTVNPHDKPTALIISGPYKISRHPMYLGLILALLGFSIILRSLSGFIPVIFMIIILETKFIPIEEKNLYEIFGQNYQEYKKKVRRWF